MVIVSLNRPNGVLHVNEIEEADVASVTVTSSGKLVVNELLEEGTALLSVSNGVLTVKDEIQEDTE